MLVRSNSVSRADILHSDSTTPDDPGDVLRGLFVLSQASLISPYEESG